MNGIWKLIVVGIALGIMATGRTRAEETAKEKPWHEGKKVEESKAVEGLKLRAFGDRVYFAGQPKTEDFKALAGKGVKTVINLRTLEETKTSDEKTAVEGAGMKYVQVPIGHEGAKDEDLKKIMDTLDGAKDAPILMHCASGNRVGYVWSIYRAKRHGLSADAAIKEGQEAGMHAPNLVESAKKIIGEKEAGAAKEEKKK